MKLRWLPFLLLLSGIAEAGVTFSNPNALNTQAIFDSTGTYTLRLTASDGSKSTVATVVITVNTSVVMPRIVGTVSSGTIAGNSVDYVVRFATGTTPVASAQFDLTLPVNVSSNTITLGQAAMDAGKSIQGNLVSAGVLRVLVFGLNQTSINSGDLAILNLRVNASQVSATLPMNLSNVAASDANGQAVQTATTNGSLIIAANKAPVVTIQTANQTITLPAQNSINLTAIASDDGAPNPPSILTYSWSVL